ncbi:MAG: hypothetical protein H6641_16815 [Caldilineaceae bacterium]|nr:hypothetical protein [Caldilineaceae bacterium]
MKQKIGQAPTGYNTINTFVIVKNSALQYIEFTNSVFEADENTAVRTPDRDGKLIDAEVKIGNSTIWPFTPSFLQVYVNDVDWLFL